MHHSDDAADCAMGFVMMSLGLGEIHEGYFRGSSLKRNFDLNPPFQRRHSSFKMAENSFFFLFKMDTVRNLDLV